ncbi:hypothetical protein [Plantactinospora sonchi]|uniref:Uncharacterized protein n=1 Tax=Plantactinospora sonchi TaxID=1544735 RepID=A0ABU7RWU0_9ACTN
MSGIKVANNNPAGRLFFMFANAKRFSEGTAWNGWAKVFGVDPAAKPDVMRAAASAIELIALVPQQVNALVDDDPAVALINFHEVEKTGGNFHRLAGMPMKNFLMPLQETGVQSLIYCSSLLSRRRPEPHLDKQATAELVEQVRLLIRDVLLVHQLDPETRDFVLRHLATIERTLKEQPLFGVRPVEQALDETVGGLYRKPHLIERLRGTPVVASLLGVVVAVDIALNMVSNYQAITADKPPSPTPAVIELSRQCGVPLELPVAPAPRPPAEDVAEPLAPAAAGS